MRFQGCTQVSLAAIATLGLSAGLMAGAAPAAGSSGPGLIVAPFISTPDDAFAQFTVTFRATDALTDSEISVSRAGNTITVVELEGGPSMQVDPQATPGATCVGNNPNGLSGEVRCSFSGAGSASVFGAWAVFDDAPRAVTFEVEANSRVRALVIGSDYDDYLQGGPLDDVFVGGGGDDFLLGAGGGDSLGGGDGEDVIYGEGGEDDNPNEIPGDDMITGGPGDDFIDAGGGNDSVWGGPGDDDIDVRDGAEDSTVYCEDSDRTRDRGSITFDRNLDRPNYCNATQVPILASPIPLSQISLVKPSTRLTAGPATWLGTTPMTYSYEWQACQMTSTLEVRSCQTRTTGSLTAAGLDASTKKAPTYTATRADSGRAIRYVAYADNSPLAGGQRTMATTSLTNVITAPPSITIEAGALPRKSGRKWSFAKVGRFIDELTRSEIGPYTGYASTAWKKAAVPKPMRKSIKDGDIFAILVDCKPVKAGAIVEAAAEAPVSFEIKFFSSIEQRKTCPVSDAEVNAINRTARSSAYDLATLTAFLDSRKCPWSVVDSGKTSEVPRFTVDSVSLGESPDEDSAATELVIVTRKPNTSEQLSLAVGAPPNRTVAQSPDHFSIGSAGAVYAFPGTVFTSIWVNLIGDQARLPSRKARMELIINGRVAAKQELAGNFSSIPAAVFTETGTARIVVSTFDNTGAVRAQVFADFDIRDPNTAPLEDLITLDGRCFDRLGRPVTGCMDRAPGVRVAGIRDVVASSGATQLVTFGAVEALRYASEHLDKRFTPIVVNASVSAALASAPRSRTARTNVGAKSCTWWDVGCLVRTVITEVAKAVFKADNKVTETLTRTSAVPIAAGAGVPAVTTATIAQVPGAGLIGLDGATLISDQGGSLIGLDGATLISDQGGSLIGLDGASLIGLDGATLIGLDGATLIGLDGATAQPNVVTLPLISAGGMN